MRHVKNVGFENRILGVKWRKEIREEAKQCAWGNIEDPDELDDKEEFPDLHIVQNMHKLYKGGIAELIELITG